MWDRKNVGLSKKDVRGRQLVLTLFLVVSRCFSSDARPGSPGSVSVVGTGPHRRLRRDSLPRPHVHEGGLVPQTIEVDVPGLRSEKSLAVVHTWHVRED